jgi:hypothetical protein
MEKEVVDEDTEWLSIQNRNMIKCFALALGRLRYTARAYLPHLSFHAVASFCVP